MSKERKSFGWRIYLSARIFCPYRISPLGAHIDHQYGKIHELAYAFGWHERGDRGRAADRRAVILCGRHHCLSRGAVQGQQYPAGTDGADPDGEGGGE